MVMVSKFLFLPFVQIFHHMDVCRNVWYVNTPYTTVLIVWWKLNVLSKPVVHSCWLVIVRYVPLSDLLLKWTLIEKSCTPLPHVDDIGYFEVYPPPWISRVSSKFFSIGIPTVFTLPPGILYHSNSLPPLKQFDLVIINCFFLLRLVGSRL